MPGNPTVLDIRYPTFSKTINQEPQKPTDIFGGQSNTEIKTILQVEVGLAQLKKNKSAFDKGYPQ